MKYINEFDHKAHLFVDMDGTLATWRQAACFEDLMQENYFRDLPPYQTVVDAITLIVQQTPGKWRFCPMILCHVKLHFGQIFFQFFWGRLLSHLLTSRFI